jgi:hypothetical protein
MSNAAKSLQERGASQWAFYGGLQGATRRVERCRGIVSRAKRRRKMASVMKVIVGSEGSRCHHDEGSRHWGFWGKLHGA